MGKVTGFMEYERLEEGYQPVESRLKNYKEIAISELNINTPAQALQALLEPLKAGHPRTQRIQFDVALALEQVGLIDRPTRSEEHTSELQSR